MRPFHAARLPILVASLLSAPTALALASCSSGDGDSSTATSGDVSQAQGGSPDPGGLTGSEQVGQPASTVGGGQDTAAPLDGEQDDQTDASDPVPQDPGPGSEDGDEPDPLSVTPIGPVDALPDDGEAEASPEELACAMDADCTMCSLPPIPDGACACGLCPSYPVNAAACEARQDAVRSCQASISCPQARCVAPPAVGCVSGQCEVTGESGLR